MPGRAQCFLRRQAQVQCLPRAPRREGRGVSPPGATYFSRARKVGKSALRGPALADFSPAYGGTQSLCASPLRTPGRDAVSVDWCSSDPGTSDAAAVALA